MSRRNRCRGRERQIRRKRARSPSEQSWCGNRGGEGKREGRGGWSLMLSRLWSIVIVKPDNPSSLSIWTLMTKTMAMWDKMCVLSYNNVCFVCRAALHWSKASICGTYASSLDSWLKGRQWAPAHVQHPHWYLDLSLPQTAHTPCVRSFVYYFVPFVIYFHFTFTRLKLGIKQKRQLD